MALATINSVLEQIDELVSHAPEYDDMQFRLRLEELVKKGGRDTEHAIAHYITGTRISVATCLNLIRMAGYIRSAAFLLPLNKVIEMSDDVQMREAAIISVSKYNDHRAMDILIRAQGKIKNRRLQETISQAMARVKSNNPLLAMLPRFLSGSKNRELFLITLKVFKKILAPPDAKSFIAYLHHGDQVVAEGAFEILCFRGDESVFFFIAEFFREQSRLLVRQAEHKLGAERFLTLLAALHEYLRRYGCFYPQLRPDIAALSSRTGGDDWGKPLIAMMADLEKNCGEPG